MVAIYSLNSIKSQLHGDQLLTDTYIGAAQTLIKMQFSHISGLKNTALQNSMYYQPFEGPINLQILHMGDTNHWTVISTVRCKGGNVGSYDSLQGIRN